MGRGEDKIRRMRDALAHREGDRVPAGEFFWTGFLNQYRRKLGDDFDPYRHFDLDYVVITPNMDPKVQPFEVVAQTDTDVTVRTGFGATIRRSGDAPMPRYEAFSVNQPDEMAEFELDEPADPRRFLAGGDDQINGVADALLRDLPGWDERIDLYVDDFAVFGSVCEPYEYLWRIIGSENSLIWMSTHPDLLGRFVDRLGRFLLDFTTAQIEAGQGRLSGMYVWGDVAYTGGMLFGVPRWRDLFKPHVKALIDLCHQHDLMVIYHGCGDARDMLDDLVELRLDGYNPLEAKAGLDVAELKRQYAGKLAFVGNVDVRVLEKGDPEAIRREVRHKLRAAGAAAGSFSPTTPSPAASPPKATSWPWPRCASWATIRCQSSGQSAVGLSRISGAGRLRLRLLTRNLRTPAHPRSRRFQLTPLPESRSSIGRSLPAPGGKCSRPRPL